MLPCRYCRLSDATFRCAVSGLARRVGLVRNPSPKLLQKAIAMSYMLLIHEPVGQRATRTEAEGRAAYAAMVAFGERLAAQGKLRAVESLAGLDSAVRVSHASGRVQTLDGPFAEAKEMIGGFFLLQDVTREQAIAFAHDCPAAQWCTVEVRALAPCFGESRA